MKHGLEHTRSVALDPRSWRRVAKSRTGRRLVKSPPLQAIGTARRFAAASITAAANPTMFSSVRTFCMFLGPVKSGGTLVGALLDAHPNVVLADEADPLRYAAAGFSRERIFHLLLKASRREARKGRVTARRLQPYSLAVPGQFQGRFVDLAVIGDSRAGPTTRRLGDHLELIGRLRDLLGDIDDRYIQVVRNPYDPISAMVIRGRRTLANAIDDYAGQCRRLATLRAALEPSRLLTLRYEDFVQSPGERLNEVCGFLGVEAQADYLSACARVVDPSRDGERHKIEWPASAIDAVQGLVHQFPFLDGYAYDRQGRRNA